MRFILYENLSKKALIFSNRKCPNGHSAKAISFRTKGTHAGFFTHHGVWAPGVRLFRALKFNAKAVIISLAFVVPLLGLIAWQLMHQAELTMQARADATRQHVEIAHGILVQSHAKEAAGKLSREQAQLLAMETIAALRQLADPSWRRETERRLVRAATG